MLEINLKFNDLEFHKIDIRQYYCEYQGDNLG